VDADIARRLKPWFPNTDIARVRVVTNGPVCWFVRRVLNQGGMTIAPYVFFGKDRFDPGSASSMALLAHELRHIEQYAVMGHMKFLFTYVRDRVRAGEYRRDLPLEVDPYALQGVVKLELRAQGLSE
jgi:hypothetical protein